jgi:CheY-like chemotaxis protein
VTLSPVPASSGRILLVEDDPDAATFFRLVLAGRGGYDVTHTADPAVALALATSEMWDLLLTDLHLPGMTGLELLVAVRSARPAMPVVMVSAHDPALLHLPCGFPDAFLHKPVPPVQLVTTIATLITRPAAPVPT